MYIVLMAGGVGTRFWPLSRRDNPKQMLKIVGKKSMIRLTYERIRTLTTPDKILVITSTNLKNSIHQEIPEIDLKNIIAEPQGRNTAPCIGLAATLIQARGAKDEVMAVLPADHLIGDVRKFRKTIKVAAEYAESSGALVTMGLKPTYPETGYGYIQFSDKKFEKSDITIHGVKTFAEKPGLDTAERFLRSGDFLWNSGMFIWKTSAILSEMDEYLPELSEGLREIGEAAGRRTFNATLKDVYSRTKPISIDYGIMEASRLVDVVQADFDWNDVGSWEAVYNILPKDKDGNVVTSRQHMMINSGNNYLFSESKFIAAIDVEGLVVVDMDDALLICRKDQSQNVKTIVEYLSRKELDQYL